MFINHLLSLILVVCYFPSWLGFAIVSRPVIDSPKPGEALQGVVSITGSTNVTGFQSSEISFSYDQPDNNNWFPIQQSSEPVDNSRLATWDTTTIADGSYRIKAAVTLKDGTTLESVVGGLRVRNYSLLETSTPSPTKPAQSGNNANPSIPINTSFPTPTDLPVNPAEVTSNALNSSALSGGLIAAVAFVLLGIYLGYRHLFRHR